MLALVLLLALVAAVPVLAHWYLRGDFPTSYAQPDREQIARAYVLLGKNH